MAWMRYYSQPTVSQIRYRAESAAREARKNGKELHPVVVKGRNVAKEGWGIAWCNNLEKYADYVNRITRGYKYVRNGAVIDLQIEKGRITALVTGSQYAPYRVEVNIEPLYEECSDRIIKQCERKIQNFKMLISADLSSEELQGIFTGKDGLFPAPNEIKFNCDCPDRAYMCKHVAAVLYGVGARLDDDPLLFFELRGIDVNRFIDTADANRVESMLENSKLVQRHEKITT